MSVHGVGFGHHGAGVFTRGVCVWQKLDGERHMHALARIDNDKSSPVRLVLSCLMSCLVELRRNNECWRPRLANFLCNDLSK
jgi:hypothetical protein